MPQGQPAVDWKNPENNAKLFAAVLALIPGTLDYKKIAKVFGPNVPANAISYRLSGIRKEGAALSLSAGSSSFSTPTKTNGTAKRAAPAPKMNKGKGKSIQRKAALRDESSDDPDTLMDSDSTEESAVETDHEKATTTPARSAKRQKTIGGRVTKRVSPRKSNKTDYKKLDDPFATMENVKDENGNNVFGEPTGTESEDTYATDGSFKEGGKEAAIKMEDAV